MSRPTFLSVFSGIGGFDLGLDRAGWECAGQIEVDHFCNRVLARHWPTAARWGDIRDVTFAHEAGEQLPEWAGPLRVDLLCGGFPCQDLSVAGRRAGLAGARSGLFFEFVRLARELRPRWLLLENVPGLLSSNGGRDFAVVLAALGDCGYGVGWRVLDARFFGVPQRRRRVFLVGRLGAPCPPEVLFEPEGVQRDLEEGGEAGQGLAGTLGGGAGKRGWCSDVERMTFVPQGAAPATAYAVNTSAQRLDGTVETLVSFNHIQDPVSSPSVAPTLGEDGMALALRLSNTKANGAHVQAGESYTLEPSNRQAVTAAAVRRLTPTECERLQAFPDGWTCLCRVEPYSTWDCRCPDGPRYAALGNAVTVNVVAWLGRRLIATFPQPGKE